MNKQYKDRLKILEDHEIDELYGLPRFDSDEQSYYFSMTQEERDLANSHRSVENCVLFILQAGYFKAKTMFFSFEFDEVQDDIRHILRQHFPLSTDIHMNPMTVSAMRWQNYPFSVTMISMTRSTHRVMGRNSRRNFLPSGHAIHRNISA